MKSERSLQTAGFVAPFCGAVFRSSAVLLGIGEIAGRRNCKRSRAVCRTLPGAVIPKATVTITDVFTAERWSTPKNRQRRQAILFQA